VGAGRGGGGPRDPAMGSPFNIKSLLFLDRNVQNQLNFQVTFLKNISSLYLIFDKCLKKYTNIFIVA